MMHRFTLLLLTLLISAAVHAQYPVVTIQQIQTLPLDSLNACNDLSLYEGDTVITHGTVVMNGGLAQAAGGRNLWIQNGTGPFSGIDLYTTGVPTPVPGTDVLDLVAGDSIEVTGLIATFGNETEIVPLNISVIDFGKPVGIQPIDVGDLNDANRVNILPTGEQWEGSYVEITNAVVTSVNFFSGNTRVSFDVADADGNVINISDRFLVQRLPAGGGSFVPPPVGARFDTLRGVIAHSGNGCTGGGGRGYEMYPFQESDYVIGFSAPIISNVNRNPVTPTSSEDVTVFASIEDPDGNVTSATLFYAVGVSNTSFLSLPMANTGTTYSATIPSTAFSDGDFVKYYISATDDSSATSTSPVDGQNQPYFFTARDNGLTIYDVQYTPFSNGFSGYLDREVTVEGIVTASAAAGDLGFVHIQQEGQTSWAGLQLVEGANLATLERGDKVRVTGTIQESFGLTRMSVLGDAILLSSGNDLPDPVEVDPNDFTTYDFALTERFEGMLVKLTNPTDGGVFVVEPNADGNNNFAEYRVGSDLLDPLNGCRVLAGRVTGTAFSSLNFSYVNDSTWISESGVINVPVCVVSAGDTLASLTGIMTYTFGNMKLLPRNNDDAEAFSGANCTDGITSVEDLLRSELTLFPNPGRTEINLQYGFDRPVRGTAELMDLTGRRLQRQALNGTQGTLRFDTRALPRGTYFLRVLAGDQLIRTHKVLLID
ncbi:MAG: T9SS C-terminal target domain-containing protein [Bacteroidetes bacterium]|nr:MAG: T9SS C-terminal target domain-containing protein [Bacteroidota bacterium]